MSVTMDTMSFWNDLPRPFFALAPMEDVTDVVFRHVVRRAGAPDVFFTEFTNATGWVHAGEQAIRGRLVKTDDEHPLLAQIWGGEPQDMENLARHCAELRFDGIDINMGCPAKSAIRSGGSALIRKPDIAIAAIAAAKTAGLPVSVKTRLGYTSIDEWRGWLTILLQQNIAALTIHLRTKKEMSKVPAHHELIPDIIKLRDEIAPETLLIINGDIADRASGLRLVHQSPGIDGIMIGRGIFHNPFCFRDISRERVTRGGAAPAFCSAEGDEKEGADRAAGPATRNQLLDLLRYHLDLFDQWQPTLKRPFETLKRFFKIYVRDFDGAKELREQLMACQTTDEVRAKLTEQQTF